MADARRHPVPALILAAAAMLTLASPAAANSGAPIAIAKGMHLLFGCAILGVIEGLILSKYLKAPLWRTILLLVAANYLSGWIGLYTLNALREMIREFILPGPALLVAHKVILILIPTVFLLTLALEHPLALVATRRPRRPRWVFLALVAVHFVTYPLLALWYSTVSSTTLYTAATHDHSLSFVPTDLDAWVYYISPNDGSVWRIRPTGRDNERIADAQLTSEHDTIFAWTTPEGRHDLRAPKPDRVSVMNVVENFATVATVHPVRTDPDNYYEYGQGDALDLRPESNRAWQAGTTWYANDGLMAHNEQTGEKFNIAFENPLFPRQFFATSATLLPGALVVYQLGDPYSSDSSESVIVVLDLNTRTLGLLARGRCPVVGLGTPQGTE